MAGRNTKPVVPKPNPIYIRWLDAYSPGIGWSEWTDEASKECREEALCEAVGWLIEETTEGLVVSVCTSGKNRTKVATPMFIPLGCVLERKDL